ncbi:hypothetical protein KBTX_04530 [wastewater metagenome]|uniref:Uncharacterized protein n=2 Tax=unclassified sequences TaxID=12908 RepID=A0A5B8RHR9_9ZZZZ|nr:hypothetical protein KBTEX_04530 [uncultured organism]
MASDTDPPVRLRIAWWRSSTVPTVAVSASAAGTSSLRCSRNRVSKSARVRGTESSRNTRSKTAWRMSALSASQVPIR